MVANTKNKPYIVGIGASAGGMEALEKLFQNVPENIPAAFIVIQHITEEHKGLTRELLVKHTNLEVIDAENGGKIEAGHVYFAPPFKTLKVANGHFALENRPPTDTIYQPIDIMLTSLAKSAESRAVGIILSGTGTDGSRGIRDIHEQEGMVIVQQPASAHFNGMPLMAIATGHADYVLSPEEIGLRLADYIAHPVKDVDSPDVQMNPEDQSFKNIVNLVSRYSNVDFGHYKVNSLIRRIQKRLISTEINSLEAYFNYLENNVNELMVLYSSLTIGVTSFFRDPEAFEAMKKQVIPELCNGKKDYDIIRIWVAGCSTGEEAYSVAILLEEFIERNKLNLDYKIFATDLDPRALEYAAIARYPAAIEKEIDPHRLQKFFHKVGDFYDITKSIRKKIVFVRHNILKDPPFIRLDLVTCRNLFIYLNADAQKRILWDYHYALKPSGFLMLGQSESMEEPDKLFERIDSKWKIYQNKSGRHSRRIRKPGYVSTFNINTFKQALPRQTFEVTQDESYAEMLAERFAPPSIIINESNDLVYVNGPVEKYLHIPRKKISLNVFKMVSKDLSLVFRNGIRKINESEGDVSFKDFRFVHDDREIQTNIYFRRLEGASPTTSKDKAEQHILVEFHDLREKPKSEASLVVTPDDDTLKHIEALEKELELTKMELNYTVQEIEHVNEELQASNEQMMTSNEELQSTNEEFQSANEELFSVNMELKAKVDELTELNNDINNLFKSSDIAIIFLDEHMNIRKFTPAVKALLNLLDTDLGRPIGHLRTNFDDVQLVELTKSVLQNGQPLERQIENTDGRIYLMRMMPYRTGNTHISGVVISFVDVTLIESQTREIAQKNEKLEKINAYLDDFVYTVAHDLRAPIANMIAFLELIKHTSNAEEKNDYITRLDQIVHRMDNMIRGLIEIIDAQNNMSNLVQPISIQDAFEQVRQEFHDDIDASNAKIITDLKVDEITYIEPYMLCILRNLLSNAIKFKSSERPLEITLKTRERDDHVELIFKDNGIGIDTNKFNSQMFKPFKRFNTKTDGKGIGLHLIKTLLEKNNGKVMVESEPENGASFKIKLVEYNGQWQ